MKTIYHYTDVYYPLSGGVQSHVDTLVNNIPNYKFEIITNAVPSINDLKYTEQSENVKIKYFSPYDRRHYPMKNRVINKMLFPYRLSSDVIRNGKKHIYLKKGDFDLLHVHGPAINMNFLSIDVRLNRCIFTNFSNFYNIKKPMLLTLHGLFSPYSHYSLFKKYEEFLINQFENIICVDKKVYLYATEYLKDTGQTKNIWYIPNSVDVNKFIMAPFPHKDKLQVGFVGRIEEPHGTKLLLELAKRMPPWMELHIVGAGSKTVIEWFKSHIDLSKVHFYSNVKYDDMPGFYEKIDILFNPVLFEAITRVSMEAMSCGRPVIMINIGDRYPVIDGRTGYIIENNVEGVLGILERIYEKPGYNEQIGKNARKVVEDEFSNDTIINRIKSVYDSLIMTK